MKRAATCLVSLAICIQIVIGQTPQTKQPQEGGPDDVVRIRTELVQTDVVVTDKGDQPVSDLKLEDFEVYENGDKQELQFIEFVSIDGPRRMERATGPGITGVVDTSVPRDLTAKELKRVTAFVVDDVTIPNEDMARVRSMLSDFLDNKMRDGELVAIVRTVGGKGLLEQFTSDRQILKRAVAQLGVRSIPPHLAFSGADPGRITTPPTPFSDGTATETVNSGLEFEGPGEGTNQIPRAILALSVSNYLVSALRQVPGRKNLVLLSGGLPLFDLTRSGSVVGDIGQLFRLLTDNATRSGVVISTMDVRGLKTSGAVAGFVDTPAKSALGGGTFAGSDENPNFGRSMDTARLGDRSPTEQLTLRTLASSTGGVSVVNSNNFSEGLDRVLNRSRAYYRLAYKPSERFDSKFHKVEVRVRRSGIRVYTAEGYYAREDRNGGTATKEEAIMAAVTSPLARRDLDVSADLQYTFGADNQAQLEINAFINATKLKFKQTEAGKYQNSFDVVGVVFDQLGRSRGGISQTVNTDFSEENYQRAITAGISYTANTQLPPGYYQVRLVVREADTGNIGSVSRYFEVPDLTNKRLTMSSIRLYGVRPAADAKVAPEQLPAVRVVSRKQDLRYAAIIYNAKMDNNKPQVNSRLIISQGGKILFQEPAQSVETPVSAGQLVRVGQLALAKVTPGRYVLTLIITDPLADKKNQTVSRSIDFTVVN